MGRLARCQVLRDSEERVVDALEWLGGEGRYRSEVAEHRAEAFIQRNRPILRALGVTAILEREGGVSRIRFRASTSVGACPLWSPVTGKPEYGLVVEPRFPWSSVGEVLSETGFRVVPELLPLSDVPCSDRHVPVWVLSSMVLLRLDALLKASTRRFVWVSADQAVPRGRVEWDRYSRSRWPHMRLLDFPCVFPDLRDDELLKAAVHFVLLLHRGALLTQRQGGVVVRRLLALCEDLLQRVRAIPPRRPDVKLLRRWRRSMLMSQGWAQGLEAIEWTVEERGLGGREDWAGLSWRMNMEVFFESWVEMLAEKVARRVGGRLRVGRLEATRTAVDWRPKYRGAQRSLVPDVIVERPDCTLILDAKYKSVAEQIWARGWSNLSEELQERFRDDFFQVLAYSTLFDTPRVVAVLVYPVAAEGFDPDRSMVRGLVETSGQRRVEVAISAVPLGGPLEPCLERLIQLVVAPLV